MQDIAPLIGENPRLAYKYKLPAGVMSIVKKREFQTKLSSALTKSPKKIHVWKNFVEFEYLPKTKFSKFRYMQKGQRGTLINIGRLKGKDQWATHHILIPTERVLNLASRYVKPKTGRKVAANPLLMTVYGNPNRNSNQYKPTSYIRVRKNQYGEWMVVWYDNGKKNEAKTYYTNDKYDAMCTAQQTEKQHNVEWRGKPKNLQRQLDNIEEKFWDERGVFGNNPNKTKTRNKSRNDQGLVALKFKTGTKIPIKEFEKKFYSVCMPDERERYERQKENYKRAHLGAEPQFVIRELIDIGISGTITDRDFVYDMGKAPEEWYEVPERSGKAAEAIHWVHKWESPPRTLITEDGKAIIKPLRGSAEVKGGWMHG